MACRCFCTKCSWDSHCRKMEQPSVTLSEGVQSATGGQSGRLEYYMVLRWKHSSAWVVTLTSKMSYSGPMDSPRLTVHPARVTARCALLSARIFGPMFVDGTGTYGVCLCWVMNLFPDGIWHPNEFSLVSARWCQTSHQQCCICLSSWRFRGQSPVEPVPYTTWGRIPMDTNVTGLKHLRLLFVGIIEG